MVPGAWGQLLAQIPAAPPSPPPPKPPEPRAGGGFDVFVPLVESDSALMKLRFMKAGVYGSNVYGVSYVCTLLHIVPLHPCLVAVLHPSPWGCFKRTDIFVLGLRSNIGRQQAASFFFYLW